MCTHYRSYVHAKRRAICLHYFYDNNVHYFFHDAYKSVRNIPVHVIRHSRIEDKRDQVVGVLGKQRKEIPENNTHESPSIP
jgi:hypothetical protein